jgi:surfeit locus 1 family protein
VLKTRWLLHAAFVTVLVILCGLGTWQVQRLAWKTQLLERIHQAQIAPPEPLSAVLNRLSDHVDVDYVRVQFDCPGLEQGATLQSYAVRDDGPGRRLVTACPIERGGYRTLLVDRGFLQGGLPKTSAPALAVPVVGVLRRPDKRSLFTPPHLHRGDIWYYRDVSEMAAELGAPDPAPVMLMLERPAPVDGNPAPSPVPISVSNNHMGYAVTWFGLAAALVGVYIAFLRRSRGH